MDYRRNKMKHALLLLSFLASALVLFVSCASTSEPEGAVQTEEIRPGIMGVWDIEKIEILGGPDEGTIIPQAGILIFTEHYYSSVRDTAVNPRPLWKSTSPSAAEMADSFTTFGADSGPYELNGSTVVFRPSVCEMPNMMSGGSVGFDYRLEGDTLTLLFKPDMLVIPGIKLAADISEERYTLKRLE